MRALVLLLLCFIISTVSAKPNSAAVNQVKNELEEIEAELKRMTGTKKEETENKKRDFESDLVSLKVQRVNDAFDEAIAMQQEDDERNIHFFTRGGNLQYIETDGSSSEFQFIDDAFNISSRNYLRFSVRACSDALITLQGITSGTTPSSEIIIEGSTPAAGFTEIKVDGISKDRVQTLGLLDCNSYQTFMVSWGDHVQLWHDNETGWELLVETTDLPLPLSVETIGFRSLGTKGHWRVVKDFTTGPTTLSTSNRILYLQEVSPDPWPLVQDPSVIFDVTACIHARIVLSFNDTGEGFLYDAIVDFNGNFRTQIRKTDGFDGKIRVHFEDFDEPILDCNQEKRFLLSWKKSRIQLLQQMPEGWNTLIEWQDYEDLQEQVNYVGFRTDDVTTGEWRLYNYFETAIDTKAGDSTPQAMAGLNDLETNLGEIDLEDRRAKLSLDVTKILLEKYGDLFPTFEDIVNTHEVLEAFKTRFEDIGEDECEEEDITCDETAEFRTITGECNNLDHPHWGVTATTQVRLLEPEYDDGIGTVRERNLPSAREVSRLIFKDPEYPDDTPVDDDRNLLMMMFGQFFDHDVTETPMKKGAYSSTVECCGIQDEFIRGQRPQCADIEISEDDEDFDVDCMNLVRSTAARPEGHKCSPVKHREQLNAITAFIDGSMIYGSEEEVAERLRSHTNGFMAVSNGDFLPEADSDDTCVTTSNRYHCFFAGDVRVNEQPGLATMHTIWVRYHNFLAQQFNNAGLTDDDTVYNIVRKINGALLQLIIYDGWLQQVLTPEIMNDYGLTIGLPYTYDENQNPSIQNQFAGVTLRYGHTLIPKNVSALNEDFLNLDANEALEDNFFRPRLVYDHIDGIGRWFMSHRCRAADRLFTPAIHQFLFLANNGFGMDLGSLNIQRGRDHGIPPYYKWREFCGLSKVDCFDDLVDHPPSVREKFRQLYSDAKDIDLFAAGVSENNTEGGHLGPTLSCLMAEQCKALKFGDRFWFENDGPTGFTTEQLANIKNMTFGSVMCSVLDIDRIPRNVFLAPITEDWVPCEDAAQIDVSLFLPGTPVKK